MNNENTAKHIPAECVEVWSKKTIEELMEMSSRLFTHLETLQSDNPEHPMRIMYVHLNNYIEKSIKADDIDLDLFL